MLNSDNIFKVITTIVAIILFTFLFDGGLATGILMLTVLIGATFWAIRKKIVADKLPFLVLAITIAIHLAAVLFIFYTNFQPFGEGDDVGYNPQIQYLAQSFRHGDFSPLIKDYQINYGITYYQAVMGVVYALTLPQMLVGQLFSVWLAVITVLLVYFLTIEIGGSKKQASFVGLIVNFYPSYIFYGSLLLKDPLIIPLAIASVLLIVKLIKNFSWRNFLIFYLVTAVLTNFRFYIGYASLLVFIFCWMLFSNLGLKKRFLYALIMIPLLGFLPQFSGNGYFGMSFMESYFSPQQIANYREQVYISKIVPASPSSTSGLDITSAIAPVITSGSDSTFAATADFSNPVSFIISYSETFIYTLLGPFPWQIKNKSQAFALFETIPWYFLFFFIVIGIIKSIKKYRITLPLVFFSITVLAVLGLFTPNFGIITRIRIPALLVLFCFAPFGFENKYINKIKNYLMQKIKFGGYIELLKHVKIRKLKKHLMVILEISTKIKNWPVYFLDCFKLVKDKYIIYNFRNGQKIKVRSGTADEEVVHEIFVCNVYTPKGFEIKDKDTVVDIGAHIGMFSIFASKFALNVYSFEPTNENFAILEENIKLNQATNVHPFKMAVSNKKGEKELFINKNNTGGHSFYKNKTGADTLLVKTTSLEDLVDSNNISKIDFLKVDCEGAEYDIILNCPKRILSMIKKISMEYHDIDSNWNVSVLKKFLEGNGFVVKLEVNSCDGSPYFYAMNQN